MSPNRIKEKSEDPYHIIQYYLDIINCMPNIVYWIDDSCNLKGGNNNFVSFFGLKTIKDFSGTPYDSMKKLDWPEARIEAFRLDDMQALFSEECSYEVAEAPVPTKNGLIYYQSTRVPLFDKNKQLLGLVVVLNDISQYKNLELNMGEKNASRNLSKTNKAVTKPKVLMVEDNEVAQKVEKALLIDLDCTVDIADSGIKAKKLFKPGKYDIVFMDIGLEDTSGYMVAKEIRKQEKGTSHHVPIIALTAYQAEVVKYDCYDYAMEGVISKPLTHQQAQQIIDHFVNHENVEVQGLKWVANP